MVVGSRVESDLMLPPRCPAVVGTVERTQSGFAWVPSEDEDDLYDAEGRRITTTRPLSDGWTAQIPEGPRLIFRDPLESQLKLLEPEVEAAAPEATHAASADAEPSSRTETLLIGAVVALLGCAVALVALFFDLF